MRRITARDMIIDERGYGWEAIITVPWDGPGSHGPPTPLVTLETPNNPEYWAYGESGPTFGLAALKAVVALAEQS